jgi:hypothetical protein
VVRGGEGWNRRKWEGDGERKGLREDEWYRGGRALWGMTMEMGRRILSLGKRCHPLHSVTFQPYFSLRLYSSFPSSHRLPPCPALCQLDAIPVWVYDL